MRLGAFTSRVFGLGAVMVVLLSNPGTIAAQDARATSEEVTMSTSGGSMRSGTTLARLAAFARGIPAPPRSLVVVAPIREVGSTRLSAEAKATLAREIATVVGAAVPGAPRRADDTMGPVQARRAARRADLSLVYLVPHMNGGSVVLEATVTRFLPNFWARSRRPAGTVTYHGQTEAKADTLLRRLLPPGRGLLTQKRQVPSPVAAPVALFCGDVQGDGGSQLLVVGRRELVLGRIAERQFLVEARRSWDELSPVAGAPLRAPLAAATLTEGRLIVGSSDRELLVELDERLAKLSGAPAAYPLQDGRCLAFSSRGLVGRDVECGASARSAQGSEFDAWSTGTITEDNGTSTQLSAWLPLGGHRLQVEVRRVAEAGLELSVDQAGHASVWNDLDGDGQVELIVSRSGDAQEDSLRVLSLNGDELVLRTESPSPPVHALATCPFSGSNPNLLVAAVGSEIWVYQ